MIQKWIFLIESTKILDLCEQQVYTMINHDYLVDRDRDHWIRYY